VEDELVKACSTHREEEEWIYEFGGKTIKKESTRKI
jgi:hypothetical protein